MVKDPLKPNERADNFYLIRAIGYLKHLRSTGLYAQLVHLLTTLLPLYAIYQSALDSKNCMVYMH